MFLYDINDTDKFDCLDYPVVMNELTTIKDRISYLPNFNKGDIIISYFKDHTIKTDFVNANPKLIKLITSGSFQAAHIELLFESCRKKPRFLKSFEDYIINNCVVP
jgi:hypothetical protein